MSKPIENIISAYTDADLARERLEYVRRLDSHDWAHEWSDDGATYRRGVEQLEVLRKYQRALDPEFLIWNCHAPACCHNGAAYA